MQRVYVNEGLSLAVSGIIPAIVDFLDGILTRAISAGSRLTDLAAVLSGAGIFLFIVWIPLASLSSRREPCFPLTQVGTLMCCLLEN